MKTPMIVAVVIAITPAGGRVRAADEPFDLLALVIEEVIVDYFGKSPRPERFSIALVDQSNWKDLKYLALPADSEKRLEKRMPERWKSYLSASEVVFSSARPQDGEPIRSHETAEGKRVPVFAIHGVQYISSKKLQVRWDYGSGPLAGVGGTFEVTKEGEHWSITRSEVPTTGESCVSSAPACDDGFH